MKYRHIYPFLFLNFLSAHAFIEKSVNPIKLRVCTTADYKPLLYKLSDGRFSGIEANIIYGFSKKEHFQPEYLIFDLRSLIPALLMNKCDLIASGIIATEERKKIVNFSHEFYPSKSFLIYSNKNALLKNAKNKEDFNNRFLTCAIQTGSVYDLELQKENIYSKSKIIKFDRESDIFLALVTQKADFTINGSHFLYSLISQKPHEFSYIEEKKKRAGIAFAFKKTEKALLNKINLYLKEINENGEYKKILKREGL